MKVFIVAQRITVGAGKKEWHDLSTFTNEDSARAYIDEIKKYDNSAIIGLRSVEEIELKV